MQGLALRMEVFCEVEADCSADVFAEEYPGGAFDLKSYDVSETNLRTNGVWIVKFANVTFWYANICASSTLPLMD